MKLILCKNCQIKIEGKHEVCPVCRFNQTSGQKEIDKMEENIIRLGWKKLTLNITFFMTLIPSAISIATDYLNNQMLSWSLLVIIPIMVSWVYLSFILTLGKKPLILCLFITIVTIGFLYVMNYLQQGNWFISFGLPLSVGIPLISYISFYLMGRNRENPLKVLGIFVFSSSLICIFIDILYTYLEYKKLLLTWSLIIIGATLPLVLILFYLSSHRKVINRWLHF